MSNQKLNLYLKRRNSFSNTFIKIMWQLVGKPLIASWVPGTLWRKIILMIFGSKIGKGGKIKPYLKIAEPWNLSIGDHCWLGEEVWIDNLAKVAIGNNVCISQGSYICTGNHNYKDELFSLILKPIKIEDECWIGAKTIIAPGSILKKGSISLLGSLVSGILIENGIYKGNPAIFFKSR